MTWETEQRSCISKFEIEAKSSDIVFKWSVTNEVDFLVMDGLNPCQNYSIQLNTFNISSVQISNQQTEARTEYKGKIRINDWTDIPEDFTDGRHSSRGENRVFRFLINLVYVYLGELFTNLENYCTKHSETWCGGNSTPNITRSLHHIHEYAENVMT